MEPNKVSQSGLESNRYQYGALLLAISVATAALLQPTLVFLFYQRSSPFPLPDAFGNVVTASLLATLATLMILAGPFWLVHRGRNKRAMGWNREFERQTSAALHDIRDMLSGLSGQASMLRMRGGDDPEMRKLLKQIEDAAEKAAEVAQQIVEPPAIRSLALGDGAPGPRNLVLVVDEDPLTRRQTRQVLSKEGYQVVAVPNPSLALDVFHSHGDELASVVVGWDHGGLEGPEILATMRRLNGEVPLIVLTALDLGCEEASYLVRGPGGLLRKPLEPDELLDTIRRWTTSQPS